MGQWVEGGNIRGRLESRVLHKDTREVEEEHEKAGHKQGGGVLRGRCHGGDLSSNCQGGPLGYS